MKAEERRRKVLQDLKEQQEPISASMLASKFSVSRQIIVGDVALLRAEGNDVFATPRGYVLRFPAQIPLEKRIVCQHDSDRMEEELQICVDHGCRVLNVIVEHPVYGQLTGELQLASRYDVEQFIKRVKEESARSLSDLTDGIHLHTLSCPSEMAYQRVCEVLKQKGIWYEQN